MKPPWDPGLGAADDSESLQTDVMRFVAILGLCLTAIFSLVNAAGEERVADSMRPAPEVVREMASSAGVESAPEQPGFTLAFASELVLAHMLAEGSVRLYAISGDDFWLLRRGGELRRSEPPASYYGMDVMTIPAAIRQRARGLPQPLAWGVTLPPGMPDAIGRLMEAHSGGAIVIGADGGVGLDRR